jgi:hypothetical protein
MMLLRNALVAAMLVLPGAAAAQATQKAIQIIVPFAPGASADGMLRQKNQPKTRASCEWISRGHEPARRAKQFNNTGRELRVGETLRRLLSAS